MEITATQKFIRLSPRKIRPVVGLIRKMTPSRAVEVLPYIGMGSAQPLMKVIKTALANAAQRGIGTEDLKFKEIQIGEGPRLKRGNPVSRGRFHPIKKRMSHIRVTLVSAKAEAKPAKPAETKIITKTKKVVKKGSK